MKRSTCWKIRNWLHRFLFRAEDDHMLHLIDDVIRLEREKSDICRNCGIAQKNEKLEATLQLIENQFPINTSVLADSNSKTIRGENLCQ